MQNLTENSTAETVEPTPLEKEMAAGAGVQLSPPPVNGPASDLMDLGRDEFGRPTSYIGQMGQKLLNIFLKQNEPAWKSLVDAEREKKQCAGQFRFYTNTLADMKAKADGLRGKIDYYKGRDLPNTFFSALFRGGFPIERIFSQPESTHILATFFLQEHGDAILSKIEAEIGAMNAEFSKWKKAKSVVLNELGLV